MLHLAWLAPTGREPQRTHARPHRALPRRGVAHTRPTSSPGSTQLGCTLAAGQLLGERYRVIGFLGRGGMGAVYRVFDRVLDQEFALKLVCDRESLREEVRLAQQVSHRNVCRTYDLEQVGGECFVKMEYIAGETLAQHLARYGTLPLPRAHAIAHAIAEGLGAAHARGIVHRDLKPSNVMLDGERVVLMDFGLATREGASDLAGTPEYMSPEQLAGGAIDARSDLYALGCVSFEMLAGVPPASAGTNDVRALRADVPRPIARAIDALLANDPAVRARGLVCARRRRARIALPLAAAAAVLAVAAAAWAMRPAPVWEPRLADLPSYEENADEPSLSPDGASFVFSSDRGHRDVWAVYVARIGDDRGEPRQLSPAATSCVSGRWTRDGRAILMSCYVAGERRIVRQNVDGGASTDLGPGWSVDDCGDTLAVVVSRPTGAAIVLRGRDARDVELASVRGVSLVRCDAGGRRILYLEGPIGHPGFAGDLVVLDRAGHARKLDTVHGVDSATFTPSGSIVLAMQRGSSTALYEVASDGSALHALTPHEQYAASPDVASDGKTLLFDRDRTSIPLFELTANGAEQKTFRFERLAHVVAAPDGRALVATRSDDRALTMVAIDPRDFSERELARGEALFISRAGRVVFRDDDDPRTLRSTALAGGAVETLATLPARVLDAAEGPDGVHVELDRDGRSEAWLVAPSGGISPEGADGLVMPAPAGGWRVVRRAEGTEVTLAVVPPGKPLSAPAYTLAATWGQPAWSGDGELAYCDAVSCRRVDVATGRDLEVTPVDPPGHRPITASGDGKRWFITSYVGHVTRERITNFADRPWAR